ncbi:MAG: hypothetical protein V2A74_08660, partial [bacterium]
MATVSMGAVDLSFEPSDVNLLNWPTYSGTTVGITRGTDLDTSFVYSLDHNNIISPSDGTEGTTCYETIFNFTDTSAPATWPTGTTLIRITDYADRHLIGAPASSGGVGGYFKYSGNAGNLQLAISIRENPVSTGDNE